MKKIIDEIIELGNAARKEAGIGEALATAHSPADASVLKEFAETFKGKIPPSFLELLSIYNGIDNFEWTHVSIFSAEYLLTHPALDESWIDAGKYKKGEIFVFGCDNNDSHCLAFLLDTKGSDGEMAVVDFDARGPIVQAKNLEAYLGSRLGWFKENFSGIV